MTCGRPVRGGCRRKPPLENRWLPERSTNLAPQPVACPHNPPSRTVATRWLPARSTHLAPQSWHVPTNRTPRLALIAGSLSAARASAEEPCLLPLLRLSICSAAACAKHNSEFALGVRSAYGHSHHGSLPPRLRTGTRGALSHGGFRGESRVQDHATARSGAGHCVRTSHDGPVRPTTMPGEASGGDVQRID